MNAGGFLGTTVLLKSWVAPAGSGGREEHSCGYPPDEHAPNSQQHLSAWFILHRENGSLLLLFGMSVLPNFPWIKWVL